MLEFTKGIKQWHLDQCSRNFTAGRDTPSPAIVIQQTLNCLPDDSDAYNVFAQIRTAILPAIKAAELGLYYPGQPTEAEREVALRSKGPAGVRGPHDCNVQQALQNCE
jgi:hypothetical protein